MARRAGVSLARVMTAAAAIYFHRCNGADEVIVGVPVAGRSGVLRSIPGMVSNVLPLRLSLSPGMTAFEVVDQVSRQVRQGRDHRRYQLADLRRQIGRGVDGSALFGLSVNVMPFNYDFSFAGRRAVAHNLSLGPVEDLSIAIYDRSDGEPLRIDFDANPERYSADELADHRQRFLRLLEAMIAAPERALGGLEILAADERHTLLALWNATARAVPQATLPELLAAQAVRTPDAVAVVFGERRLSYAALQAHANRLAHHLRRLGVGPETVVGLCVERSVEMVIGLVGILNAGAAYLPLDPDYPPERLSFMLQDAGAAVLVTQAALQDRLRCLRRCRWCGSMPTGRRSRGSPPRRRCPASTRSIQPT